MERWRNDTEDSPDGTVEWLGVIKEAIKKGVLLEEFIEDLRKLL